MKKAKLHTRETPELLRSRARRDAHHVGRFKWRPSKQELANLRASTRDAIAYRIMARAWRSAGFKIAAIRRLANRKLKPRERNSPPPRARTSLAAAQEQLQFTR
jgi:hypothetical protein